MYIPTYDTLISKLESILRYIHVIHFWKWETISDMTVKSQMINSRKIFAAEMDTNTKLLFLQDFPKFVDIKSSLLSKRRQMIPPDPKVMSDIDNDLPVFLTKKGENVVKGEQVLSDGRRVILFTTNEHLKFLARAHQILGDGTFWKPIFGLAYVPLARLAEAVRNLYILAKKLDDCQAKFAVVLIHHVERTCSFPPET